MKRLYGTIVSLLTLSAFLLTPQLAHAADTGIIDWVRTCPDGAGGQKVVVHLDLGGGVTKTIFLGVDAAGTGSSPITTLATSAMLSGRTVTIERSSNATTQCGISALFGNATTHYIQLNGS